MLLVGDGRARADLACCLEDRGFSVDLAPGPEQGLQRALDVGHPVVVVDTGLPRAAAVAAELKRRRPRVAIVAAEPDPERCERASDGALSEHCATWLQLSPLDADAAAEQVHRALRMWEQRASQRPSYTPARSILLLEDNDADAELICAYLSTAPKPPRVHRERRLLDAMASLEGNDYEVIVSDLSLPDARGLDAVLRLQNVASDTPLIVMTSAGDEQLGLRAIQAGAQDFLIKDGVDGQGLLRSIRYASERKRSELDLSRLAHYDALTGLANRTQFSQRLEHALSRARRTAERVAVLFVDLDGFKPVNDRLGHAVGDALLVETSRRLERCVREHDTLARLGGDEFAAVLDNLKEPAEATRVSERMLTALAQPLCLDRGTAQVTASIGVAIFPEDAGQAHGLVRAADEAMYAAKAKGRNTYALARACASSRPVTLRQACEDVEHALAERQFVLHYQPQFDVRQRRIAGAEALLRWHRNGRDPKLPGDFLPLLERSSQIVRVGAWALRGACQQLVRFRQRDLFLNRICVNVSGPELRAPRFLDTVVSALEGARLEPDALQLEFGESVLCALTHATRSVLNDLNELGVRLALDDFGSGASSLTLLHGLPLTGVKLHGSRIRDGQQTRGDRALVRALIMTAQQLELEVTAEGVETEVERAFLEQEGCDLLQGYLFGRPASPRAFRAHVSQLCPKQLHGAGTSMVLPPAPAFEPRTPASRKPKRDA